MSHMLNDPALAPVKPHREWTGEGKRRKCRVDTDLPYGRIVRGWIRPIGLADTNGPGLAGRTVWSLKTYDHVELEPVTGDYVTAEEALLDATRELED